jgi:hypothetical protein
MGETELSLSIERYVRARRRPGIMLIISDLLSGEPDQFSARLRDLRSRGWQTIVAHIVDSEELSPLFFQSESAVDGVSPTELLDLESGERLRLTLNPDVIGRYEHAVSSWLGEIEAACAAEHADYLQLQTDWPLQSVVLQLLHARGLVE